MAVATERSEREPLGVSAKLAPLSLRFRVQGLGFKGSVDEVEGFGVHSEIQSPKPRTGKLKVERKSSSP